MEGFRFIGCHEDWVHADAIEAAFVNAPGYLYQHAQHVLHVDFIVAERPPLFEDKTKLVNLKGVTYLITCVPCGQKFSFFVPVWCWGRKLVILE